MEGAFGGDIDYAMLIKLYADNQGGDPAGWRYSGSECIGTRREVFEGRPHPVLISTSYLEHQKLMMRMSMQRFTTLTNAYSKKFENTGALGRAPLP